MTPLQLTLYSLLFLLSIKLIINFLTRSRTKQLPPGPKAWPIVGNLPHLGPTPHQNLAILARKYGPLLHLRLGYVHVVVAASASVAAQFLKINDANFSNRPPNSGAKHIAYNYQDLVFAPYGPRWRMLRKICAVHLFSAKALDDFRHVRQRVGRATAAQSLTEAPQHKARRNSSSSLRRISEGPPQFKIFDLIAFPRKNCSVN